MRNAASIAAAATVLVTVCAQAAASPIATTTSTTSIAGRAPALATLHVCAATGDDANEGTSERAPLRTLQAARDTARRLRSGLLERQQPAERAVEVVLHGAGVHHLTAPLVLDARDSNTIYRAADGEDVLVSGGVAIDPAAVSPRPGHAGQYEVNMTAMGLADLGTVLPTSTGTSGPDASGARGHEELGQRLHPQLFIGEQAGLCKSARQPVVFRFYCKVSRAMFVTRQWRGGRTLPT